MKRQSVELAVQKISELANIPTEALKNILDKVYRHGYHSGYNKAYRASGNDSYYNKRNEPRLPLGD